ncbi:unnamed protein product [Toxocara canis]|uniref:Uncharacterized protein n=1 Tax=Toxocara canis TaxID=6265 RepID=A0A183V9S7_TOXCA|nr:unnamed protein product [Toxocara canis]
MRTMSRGGTSRSSCADAVPLLRAEHNCDSMTDSASAPNCMSVHHNCQHSCLVSGRLCVSSPLAPSSCLSLSPSPHSSSSMGDDSSHLGVLAATSKCTLFEKQCMGGANLPQQQQQQSLSSSLPDCTMVKQLNRLSADIAAENPDMIHFQQVLNKWVNPISNGLSFSCLSSNIS